MALTAGEDRPIGEPVARTGLILHDNSTVFMDTVVSLQVVASSMAEDDVKARTDRAFGWFQYIEQTCSRFEDDSEITRLAARPGVAVPVSALLFEAVRFALEVARGTNGVFDPTVGHVLWRRGFAHNYRTGRSISSPIVSNSDPVPTYRDVILDPVHATITLRVPLVLDLGAVAKGLAIDLAAKELDGYPGYVVSAGGDLYARGYNVEGQPWHIGIQHPVHPTDVWEIVHVSDMAVCTSGGYRRPSSTIEGEHHIVDPRTGHSPRDVTSVTVVAPTAMVADALATAASLLGPERGLRLLRRHGVDGMIISATLKEHASRGFRRYRR